MYRNICLVVCSVSLCSCLAADVTIYNSYDYNFAAPKPVAVSQFPWMFGYCVPSNIFYMRIYIYIRNKSPSVTAINVKYTTDDTTHETKKFPQKYGPRKGQEYYLITIYELHAAEIQIQLNLYSSNMVCSSFLLAKGRNVAKKPNESKEEFPHFISKYFKLLYYDCVIVVDLANKCVGPPLVTGITMKPFTDGVNSNNKTLTNNVLNTSRYENIDTATVKNVANTKNADHTDYTIIIISVISSISGTLLILLLAIWKRCWCECSPSGTPQLPPHEPFYLNMLFRRECDQEIAEIDQHQYEEIIP